MKKIIRQLTLLKGVSVLPGDTPVLQYGDSILQHALTQSSTANSEELSYWSRGIPNWAWLRDPRGMPQTDWYDASVTNRLAKGTNNAVSGIGWNTISNQLGDPVRLAEITGRPNHKYVEFDGPTNDLNSGDSAATCMSRFATIVNHLHDNGTEKITYIFCPPRPLAQWASGGAIRLAWLSLCDLIQAYIDARPGWLQAVRADLLLGDATADREPLSATYFNADGVHLAPLGVDRLVRGDGVNQGLIQARARVLAPFTAFPSGVQAGDLAPDPLMAGSVSRSGTGWSGVWPTNMTGISRSGGTGVSVVASKESVNGKECLKLVFTRTGAAPGTTSTFTFGVSGGIASGLPATGDWLRGWMKAKWTNNGGINAVSLRSREQPSAGSNMDAYAMKTDSGQKWPTETFAAAGGGCAWMATPPWQFRANGTSILWNPTVVIDDVAAGTDTVWLDEAHLLPISDPRPALGF